MAETADDKTQDPTPHRRQQARERGQFAKSQDLASAVLLTLGLGALVYWGGDLCGRLMNMTEERLSGGVQLTADPDAVLGWCSAALGGAAWLVLPLLGLLWLAAVLVEMGQVGIGFWPERAMPDPARLNPWLGLRRLFSPASGVRLGFSLAKIAATLAVIGWVAAAEWESILGLVQADVPQIAAYLGKTVAMTALKVAAALLLLALADYAFQWWRHEQDLRMTVPEIREEMRNLEGDPQRTARRKLLQREIISDRKTKL